jgi:phenylpropionate dioxygenase-like ring-hydroxylating dioxygenase large terminal subunit
MYGSPELLRHDHPVLRSRALGRRPLRTMIGTQACALFRDGSGTPRALLDRCAHRFAPLSRGSVHDGRLQCRYHGWSFDGDGAGQCPSQPSLTCSVPALRLRESHGWLWLAGREADPAQLPLLADDEYRLAGSLSLEAAAPMHVALDNFNEDEHTPFIHGRLGWSAADAAKIEFETVTHDDSIEVTYAAPQRASWLLPLVMVRRGDTFHNHWFTRFSPVHIVYTLRWTDPRTRAPRPLTLRFGIFFVPIGERRTRIVAFVFTRVDSRWLRPLQPALDPVVCALAWKEIFDDRRWLAHIADTPYSFRGMRLDRFDAPLARSRRLLDRIYFGAGAEATAGATGSASALASDGAQ